MTAPQKTHDADDETLEYIADLEQENERIRQALVDKIRTEWSEKGIVINDHSLEDITEIEWLKKENAKLEDRCRALELSAMKSAEEAEKLKDALRFYASEENYYAKLVTPEDELYPVVIIPVCDDRGEIARRALKELAT